MTYTREQLQNVSQEELITIILHQQDDLAELKRNTALILEQLQVMNQQRFGRKSEKDLTDYPDQLTLADLFNEVEGLEDIFHAEEPSADDILPATTEYTVVRKKHNGKRDEDLKGLPVDVHEHELPAELLDDMFPGGWYEMDTEEYKRLKVIPADYRVQLHRVHVYSGYGSDEIVRGDRPAGLLRNSIATPSLVSMIINAKYTNAVPLYRLEQEFKRNDIHLSRQVMANWMIRITERYLQQIYDLMHQELLKAKVLQADETPCLVSKDGRKAGSKSYMWVYRTGKYHPGAPVILYEYQKTRNTEHPLRFLSDYDGTVVTDGYEVYHSIARKRDGLKIAGCWSHARRKFADAVKTAKDKEAVKTSIAYHALQMMQVMFDLDKKLRSLPEDEILKRRCTDIQPLVEAFFAWIRKYQGAVPSNGLTGKAITYCLNQEQYLKVFLDDPYIPMDNNAAEQAIRGFCIGKKNWVMIDTISGAKASAVLYSIVETAKANNLKIYDYFCWLLQSIIDTPEALLDQKLEGMMPWSDKIPESCRKNN